MSATRYLLEAFGIKQATDDLSYMLGLDELEWDHYEMDDADFASLCSTL
jgi:hypothetical protein